VTREKRIPGLDLRQLLAEITRIAPNLHKAGTFSQVALEALLRHASSQPIAASVETGSGASTLLLSHLSQSHTVFAIDAGTGSIRAVEASPLLRRHVVTFVEGPTQRTLPVHRFDVPLQLALIDGPHGYPFPDLEYYFLYPHLDAGALLIVDDIQIPTITNLFDFLRADEMFALQEVVETTAFFRRTDAPTFSPTGDGWWLQAYNKRAFEPVPIEIVSHADTIRARGAATFYIDKFGSATNLRHGQTYRLAATEAIVASGWALDTEGRSPAHGVDFLIDGRAYRARTRVPRGDVAHAHGSATYFRSGFLSAFAPDSLRRGEHDVEVRVVTGDGRRHLVAMRFRLELV
jgi:hypothetical protein